MDLVFEMASKAESGGRILALGLMVFFIVQVIRSTNKLRANIVAVSTTTEYEEKRLMPSISVCFPFMKSEESAGSELEVVVQKTLNDSRHVNLIGEVISNKFQVFVTFLPKGFKC